MTIQKLFCLSLFFAVTYSADVKPRYLRSRTGSNTVDSLVNDDGKLNVRALSGLPSSLVDIPTTAINDGTDSAFSDTDTDTDTDTSTADASIIMNDIPGTAIDAGLFSTLVAALNATDLVDALSTPNGPYTVFAPTDDAFAALPEGLVTCLFEEENVSVLSNILLYHVVSGQALLSTDLSDRMILPTVFEGHNVWIGVNSADDGTGMLNTGIDVTMTINNAAPICDDILTSNGVIHSLDMVLIPSSIDVIAILNTCTDNTNGGGEIVGDVADPVPEPAPVSSSTTTTTTTKSKGMVESFNLISF